MVTRRQRPGMPTNDWPKDIGGHTVTMQWECEECGASYDCLENFRQNECT